MQLENYTTWTGIPADERLFNALATLYPPSAYGSIQSKSYLSDIDNGEVTKRLHRVFGPAGFGWGLKYEPEDVQIREYETQGGKPRFEVVITKAKFWYKLVAEEGGVRERHASIPVGAGSDNDSIGDALKGAISSCIKKAISWLGHQSALYCGHLTHSNIDQVLQQHGVGFGYLDKVGEFDVERINAGIKGDTAPEKTTKKKVEEEVASGTGRPFDPETVKANVLAGEDHYIGEKVSRGQRGIAISALENVFTGEKEKKRKQVLAYIWPGAESMNDVTNGGVLSLLDWLDPERVEDEGGKVHYLPSTDAIAEAKRIIREE